MPKGRVREYFESGLGIGKGGGGMFMNGEGWREKVALCLIPQPVVGVSSWSRGSRSKSGWLVVYS